MGFPAQPAETARGIDVADVRTHALEGGEGAAFGLDLAQDVFADRRPQIRGRAGEPSALFVQEVRGDALGFLPEEGFVAPGLVQRADGLVDFFAPDGTAGFEPVGGGEFVAGGLLGGDEVAEEDVAVRQSLFDDEGVGGVVVEWVAEGGGFRCALGSVIIAGCLYYLA